MCFIKLETETLTKYIQRNSYQKLPVFILQDADFFSLSNDSNLKTIEQEEDEENEKNDCKKV